MHDSSFTRSSISFRRTASACAGPVATTRFRTFRAHHPSIGLRGRGPPRSRARGGPSVRSSPRHVRHVRHGVLGAACAGAGAQPCRLPRRGATADAGPATARQGRRSAERRTGVRGAARRAGARGRIGRPLVSTGARGGARTRVCADRRAAGRRVRVCLARAGARVAVCLARPSPARVWEAIGHGILGGRIARGRRLPPAQGAAPWRARSPQPAAPADAGGQSACARTRPPHPHPGGRWPGGQVARWIVRPGGVKFRRYQ